MSLATVFVAGVFVSGALWTTAAYAQSQTEIDLIEQLGDEEIAAREARERAQAEQEHHERLEEQSRLREAYRQYLGHVRRTATAVAQAKARRANAQEVAQLRTQARTIIDRPGLTKAMVQAELDPVYARLEAIFVPTREDLYARDSDLLELRRRIAPGNGSEVDWIEEAAILYALCTSDAHRDVIAGNIPFRDEPHNLTGEAVGIDLCNRRRIVLGLNPLGIDMKLVMCGRDHSKDMVEHNFFAHNSPVEGKATPWDRARNFGTSASGENIAAGYGNETAATMGWWYSPGHLKNMMGQGHRRIGLGRFNNHYTQMFGR